MSICHQNLLRMVCNGREREREREGGGEGGEVDSKHVFLGAAHTWCLSTSTWVPAKLCCVHTLGTR